ncbi:MAG TPA: zf-HC2 domain-containing protein [Dehalococcoidia bacterium]
MGWFSRDAHPEEQLSAYVDGELDSRSRRDVLAHLATCDACSTLVDELRQTKSMVASLPREAAPRSFVLGPEYAVPRREPARRSSFTFAPVAALTVLLALLFVDAANFSSSTSSDDAGGATSGGAPAAARQAESTQKDSAAGAPQDTFQAPQATPAAQPGSGTAATQVPPATRAAESATGTGANQPQAASSTADAAATQQPSRAPQTAESAPTQAPLAAGGAAATPVAPAPQDGLAGRDTEEGPTATSEVPQAGPEDSSSGLSTLRILEIVAAAALVASLAVVYLPRVRSR